MEEKQVTPLSEAPQDAHTLLPVPGEGKAPTTVGQRFGGFAMGHLTFSVLLAFSFPVWGLIFEISESLAGFLPMVAYFPMGYLIAALEEWTTPQSLRERYLSVVYPTAVAWLWVAIVLVMLFLESEDFFLGVFVTSLFLAAPSSIFVLFFGLGSGGVMRFILMGLLAGFLPPLFFAYGSFW